MKKIELFILRSYIGPLLMTFFISLFILLMQGVWKYVNDIVGKGIEIPVIAELLFYLAIQLTPMALPLAILLAALMTFGNLGENYELTALKASGISLWRIMRPIAIVTFIISISAFWFSNNVLPVANLKFYTLLNSIRNANPEMEFKEKTYCNTIKGFRIKVDRKNTKTGMMYDLVIHDHRDEVNNTFNTTLADSGKIDINDKLGLVELTLYSGITYDEKVALSNKRLSDRERQMYRHDEFSIQKAQIKVDGMSFTRMSEDMLRDNYTMKGLSQLKQGVDSLQHLEDSLQHSLHRHSLMSVGQRARSYYRSDSAFVCAIDTGKIFPSLDSLAETLTEIQKKLAYESAVASARRLKQTIDDHVYNTKTDHGRLNRHIMERHKKFTMPLACLLFFFIGAPLGAIIRKGGLGMPIVISVIFFIIYYVIDTFGMKMAREDVWFIPCGMWLSTSILLVIGIFLTYKSATDSDLFRSEAYTKLWLKIQTFLIKVKILRPKEAEEQNA
ncbi:MAG: LptF/LptG family permease [Bacteroidales bacterium]|nr:LptF/LptG family permease [Bacteroidales bacterium]